MAKKPDVILREEGVKLVGSGQSPEVDIEGGNHWNLAESDGDLRIGDEQYMLKMGVSLGGGGAGNARIWATSKLKLGSGGESVVSVDGEGLHPENSASLGSHQSRWSGLWLDGDISVNDGEVALDADSSLECEGSVIFTGQIGINGTIFGDLVPAGGDLGSSSARWDTLYVDNVNKSSDGRLKSDVEDLENGLETVRRLRPVSFTWSDDGDQDHLGFIGQEVAEILPEIVSGTNEEDGHLGLDYTELVPVLVDAVQSHREETEKLEEKVAEQRETIERQDERMRALEERLETLEAQAQTAPPAE